MSTIKFRLAAKTDMGLVRTNNEDNFQVASDLSSEQMRWVNNEICSLGEKGTLLVVADGMGGMNAGEVASELAIETVRDYFSSENLTPEVTKTRFSIEKYMNDAIVAADVRIKMETKAHPETRGMGTTIVIGWVLGGKLYVSWCGDSRAYIYNPEAGLHQITKDHSYVQTLVDKGAISREDAFDYPDSNIITRSLSDAPTKAIPESLLKPYDLCNNDIVLLCTDGLCGMIRDKEMEALIRNNEHDMNALLDSLIHAAYEAEGSDNITICLCQILQGGGVCNPAIFEETENRLNGGKANASRTVITNSGKDREEGTERGHKGLIIFILFVILVALGVAGWFFKGHYPFGRNDEIKPTDSIQTDTTSSSPNTDIESGNAIGETNEKIETNLGIEQNKQADKTFILEEKHQEKPSDESQDSGDYINKVIGGTSSKQEEVEEKVEAEELNSVGNINSYTEEDTEEDKTSNAPNKAVSDTGETDEYTVKERDTYNGLANNFGTTVDILRALNNGKELKAGETIKIPKQKK